MRRSIRALRYPPPCGEGRRRTNVRRQGGVFVHPKQSSRPRQRPPDPAAIPDPDEHNLALQKLAFEVCVRINAVTPITPVSLVTLALLGNAFICAVISGPHDRYGARMVWLAALTVMLASARLAQDRLGRPRKVA